MILGGASANSRLSGKLPFQIVSTTFSFAYPESHSLIQRHCRIDTKNAKTKSLKSAFLIVRLQVLTRQPLNKILASRLPECGLHWSLPNIEICGERNVAWSLAFGCCALP